DGGRSSRWWERASGRRCRKESSLACNRFDCFHDIRRKGQGQTRQILLQVFGVAAAGQWQDADSAGETEDHLRGSNSQVAGEGDEGRVLQDLGIGGEQRESLVGDVVAGAEVAHIAIPSETSETAVLDECWQLGAGRVHLLEMI